MTALPVVVPVGPWTGQFVWVATPGSTPARVPSALLVDHGDHTVLLPWAPVDTTGRPLFTLDSLIPLTLVELVSCPMCGARGRIERGVWVPAEGGARG